MEAAYEDPERQVFLPTLNLSETGVFLLSSERPAIGSKAQIVLEIPGHEAFLRLKGVVTRVQEEPGGFALQFDPDVPGDAQGSEALAALREFVCREMGGE